jgi:hypothetical protein
MLGEIFSFPNPVNEKAARTVAGGVLAIACLALARSWYWLLPVLAYGFLARVLTGPTFSPLGRLATRVIAPRLGPERPVPGPPKRFAQATGATLTIVASVAALGFAADTLADVLLAALILAAGLESILGYCLGCRIFALLIRAGLVPESVCLECADISRRHAAGA